MNEISILLTWWTTAWKRFGIEICLNFRSLNEKHNVQLSDGIRDKLALVKRLNDFVCLRSFHNSANLTFWKMSQNITKHDFYANIIMSTLQLHLYQMSLFRRVQSEWLAGYQWSNLQCEHSMRCVWPTELSDWMRMICAHPWLSHNTAPYRYDGWSFQSILYITCALRLVHV